MDENGVILDGRVLATRSQLTHGHVVRVGEELVLRLAPRGRITPIEIALADEAQGTAILRALRLDRTVAEYRMRANLAKVATARMIYLFGGSLSLAFVGMLGAAVIMSVSPSSGHGIYAVIPFVLWALGMSGSMASAVASELFVSVGEDGLWLRQPLVGKRFLSFRDLRAIDESGRDIMLRLVDGTTVNLHHQVQNPEAAADLITRIRAGIASFADAPKRRVRRSRATAARLPSGSRTRKKHERSANYRAAVVPQDELWRIVEDASAAPTERAGAALALRARPRRRRQDAPPRRCRCLRGDEAPPRARVRRDGGRRSARRLARAARRARRACARPPKVKSR